MTERERQILALLAEGRSGSQIAAELVLSPETVRTHARNAMSKLGATTRSHAVALALQRGEIGNGALGAPGQPSPSSPPDLSSAETSAALDGMLGGLVTLYDVDGGGVYACDEDALSLCRVAATGRLDRELPERVVLGDGTVGRAALERRAQLAHGGVGASGGALIAAPILAGGRLLGVLALGARGSRPISRSELLLVQAFANRVGEVVSGGDRVGDRLARATERFRASWSAASRVA